MAIAFDPDGKRIGFGTADGSLWLWAAKLGSRRWMAGPVDAPVRGRFDIVKNKNGEPEFNFPCGTIRFRTPTPSWAFRTMVRYWPAIWGRN